MDQHDSPSVHTSGGKINASFPLWAQDFKVTINTPWDLLIDCSNTWFRDSVLAHIGPFMTVRKIHSELKMLLPRKDSVHL